MLRIFEKQKDNFSNVEIEQDLIIKDGQFKDCITFDGQLTKCKILQIYNLTGLGDVGRNGAIVIGGGFE